MVIEKEKLLYLGSIGLGFLVLLGAMIWAINAFSFKVATFDISKISKESEYGQELKKDLDRKFSESKARIELAKTNEEKAKIEADFNQFRNEKQGEFTDRVSKTIKTIAKRKGIKAVANPQVFVYSDEDITDDVIKELAK